MKTSISITVAYDYDELINAAETLTLIAEGTLEVPANAITPLMPAAEHAEVTPISNNNTVALDEDGLPWDSRIHSSSKKQTQKGLWKLARGIDKNLVTSVLAELNAGIVAPAPEPTVVAPAPEPTVVAPAPEPTYMVQGNTYTHDELIGFNWTEDQINELKPIGQVTLTTFPELLKRITDANIDEAVVQKSVVDLGLTNIALVAARPDLIPAIEKALFIG